MRVATQIAFFCLFLVCFFLWLSASGKLAKRLTASAHKSELELFLVQEAMIVVSYAGFFVLLYLLSGFFVWQFTAAFFAVGQIGILTSLALRPIFGAPGPKTYQRSFWGGVEFGMKNRFLMISALILVVLVNLAYPVFAGIAYFRSPQSPALTLKIFQYTLVTLFAGGLFIYPTLMALIGSKNIDEATRLHILISQCGAIIPNAVLLALVFLAFGGNIEAIASGLRAAVPMSLWIQVLVALMALFMVTAIIPYLIGAHRASKFRHELAQSENEWVSKIEEILSFPSSQRYVAELGSVRADIEKAKLDLIQSDVMVAIGESIDRGNVPDEALPLLDAYRECRNTDPRFKYIDTMRNMLGKIDEILTGLESKTSDDDKVKFAEAAARIFKLRADKLKETLSQERGASPLTKIALPAAGMIASAILSSAGKYLWETMSPYIFSSS